MKPESAPASKLVLGTVQFGLDYGITNLWGKPSEEVVADILEVARDNKITHLDTASAYGNSEDVLGRLGTQALNFSIMTKTPGWNGAPPDDCVELLKTAFENSLLKLGRDRLQGIMVHFARDLSSVHGRRIWDALRKIKGSGEVEMIGISFYGDDPIRELVDRFQPDFVQLPISALDQRLVVNNTLKHLRSQNVEIHARSVFLQGLLLPSATELPGHLSELVEPLRLFAALCEQTGLTRLQGALSFIRSIEEVSKIIVGVTSPEELTSICSAHASLELPTANWNSVHCDNSQLVDPRYWPTK